MRKIAFGTLIMLVFAAGGLALWVWMKEPGTDRDWQPKFAKTASFAQAGERRYTLQNERTFEFLADGSFRDAWRARDVDGAQVKEIWLFVEPFAMSDLFAHTFLSFVFEDDAGTRDVLSVSVEARLEADESYSFWRGLLRDYELSYVWSTEKDVMTRIAVGLDHPLYAYRLNPTTEQARVIFDHFVARTNDLAARPRFYNTLFSNCTNELFKAVNDAYPGVFPENTIWALTGRSARWMHELGFMTESTTPFDALTSRANVQSLVKEFASLPPVEFSQDWRAAFAAAQD